MAGTDPASASADGQWRALGAQDEKSGENRRLPGPRGAPFAWAESRQELCETLPYYRAYHSGCYATSAKVTSRNRNIADAVIRDQTPFGYLLGGFGASRDAWEHEGRVIISHGGGKSGIQDKSKNSLGESGSKTEGHKVQPTGDQTFEDGQTAALVHSHRCQTPIVMLMAKDYKLSHFKLPCAFAVLGWYWITDVWCEREPCSTDGALGWVRWKFRFQYVESQGHPWWLGNERVAFWSPSTDVKCDRRAKPHDEGVEMMTRLASNGQWSSGKRLRRPTHLTSVTIGEQSAEDSPHCPTCQKSSPLVFKVGWMCLSQDCDAFWKLGDDSSNGYDFEFDPGFLAPRQEPLQFAHGGMPFSLHPPARLPFYTPENQGDIMRGFHCTCGRLTCRSYDHYWHCAHCGFIRPCQAASEIHRAPSIVAPSGIESCKVHPSSGIRAVFVTLPSDRLAVTSFYFPPELGSGEVHLIESMHGKHQKETDQMFEEMQRGPYWNLGSDGSLAPYYPRETIPFRRHPLSCHAVKGDLLSQQFTCNYGAEYKHSVKMGTVCLDQAPNCIRSALDLITERTRKVIPPSSRADDFNEVYPVKYRETQKMNFHDDGEPGLGPTVSSLSLGVEARMSFRLKEKYVGKVGHSSESQGTGDITMANRTLLNLTLRHGCIVIQHGRKLQDMIEHAVQPQMGVKQRGDNGVRIAVTARRIDKVNAEAQRQSKKQKTFAAQSVMKLPGGAGWAGN